MSHPAAPTAPAPAAGDPDDPFAELDADPDLDAPDGLLERPRPPMGVVDRVAALADATGVTPGRLVSGAVALTVLATAAVWALRPPPPPPELELPYIATTAVAAPLAPGTSPGGTADEPAEPDEPDEVVVHVAGAVVEPGVHRLDPGARVVEAITAAGGLTSEADEARVNLAAPLVDGERVYVPRDGEDDPPAPVAGSAPSPGPASTGQGPATAPVDLNRATQAELESLPGVGPATAAAILEHRARIGAFTSVDQLLDVRGIGPAKLDQLRPHARV